MITGTAAVFYDGTPRTEYHLGGNVFERIGRNAFDTALRSDADVLGLFNHSLDNLLGRTSAGTLQLSIDQRGLNYRIPQAETDIAKRVMTWQQTGDITGSSFWFRIRDGGENIFREEDRIIREVTDVDLIDVGPVTTPAYEATSDGDGRCMRFTGVDCRAMASLDSETRSHCRLSLVQARMIYVNSLEIE